MAKLKKLNARITSIHTRNVPLDTKAQFKAYCARRGYTMEAAMVALMRKAARDDIPLPEAREARARKLRKEKI